jgi:tetratricopeptide (TPR) repeat protein
MTHLGLVMLRMCKMADAKKAIDRGLEIRRSFFSDEHLCIANSHFALAKWHQATSSFRVAMSHMQQSYEIRLKSLGPDAHHLVAQSLLGMAEITREEGFPVAAQPIYEAALDMFRECYRSSAADNDETMPARHLRTARALYGMGVNLLECGKFARAAEAIQEAQKFRTLQLPLLDVEFHWEISAGNIALANCLMEMGRLEEAKTLLVAAGKTLLGVFGAQHILIAQGLLVLGKICFARGQFKDATKMFQNCLAQQTEILGRENQRLVPIYYAMVLNHLGPGDYDEAIEACNKCVEIVASALPHDEQQQQGNSTLGGLTAIFVLHARAQILRDTGTLDDAHVLFEQGLLYIRNFFGGSEESTYFAVMLGELGECLRLQGKTSQAEAAIEESLRLRRQHFGDAHVLVAEALRFKVLLMLDKGMPNEAADLLEDAVLPLLDAYFAAQLASSDQHPAVVIANGVLGICLKAIHAKEFGLELEPGQERESTFRDKLDYAQDMIDDALDFFDVYKQGSFNDLHPWILRLGGFASTMNSAEHSRVSTAASARMTTASYSSLRVNSSALSSRPHTTTSSFSLVGAFASRPPTVSPVLPLTITIDEDDDRAGGGDQSDSPEMRSTAL